MVPIAVADDPAIAAPASPYRGIQPFRYADHPIFFAREEETALLLSLVAVYRGVFLYGDSGNGKSSLVNAGLLPRALALGFEPVRVRVQPRTGEELVVEAIELSDGGDEALPLVLADDPAAKRVVLSVADFEARVRAASQTRRPLVVFDQFEEILTLFEDAAAARDAIALMLVRLLRDELPVKLVFAFREDYLGRVKQLLAAQPDLVDRALRLGPPSGDALDAIIRGPFERFPGHYERELGEGLAERLRAALEDRFGTGEVSLSEVQTVCLRLWRASDPHVLLSVKGVQGLLEDELGEALEGFAPDVRVAAIALLSHMVTAAGTRNVISAEDLRQRVRDEDESVAPELLDEALDRLERESKLVRRERRRDIYLYEITSEFLVPWISRRRDELQRGLERRRERRRLRLLAVIAGALLLVAVAVAVLALWALRQRTEAEDRATDIESLALVTSASEPLRDRPDLALALAYEAFKERPLPEAHAAVVSAIQATRQPGFRGMFQDPGSGYTAAFSDDGRTLATAGSDSVVRVWDVGTRTQIGRLVGPTRDISAMAFSADGTMLATADRAIRIWNVRTRRPVARLPASSREIVALAFHPDGKTLASADDKGVVTIWSRTTRDPVGRLPGNLRRVDSLLFSPGGETLVTAGFGRGVRMWDSATRRQRARLHPDARLVGPVAFSPDGKTLAVDTLRGPVRLFDAASGALLRRLTGKAGPATALVFSHDGKLLASDDGFGDGVHFWDPATGALVMRLAANGGARPTRFFAVPAMTFGPDDRTLASASADGTIALWSPPSESQLGILARRAPVWALALSPDGELLATAESSSRVRLSNPRTRTPRGSFRAPPDGGADLELSPDGRALAVADPSGVRLRDPATRRVLGRLRTSASVHAMAFSPGGKALVTIESDSSPRDSVTLLWDDPLSRARTSAPRRIRGSDSSATDVAFSHDGRFIVTVGASKIALHDAVTLRSLGTLGGTTDSADSVAFSPDDRTLAVAGADGVIRLWDFRARRPVAELTGHSGSVNRVVFSPDGAVLASASSDHTVLLWDAVIHAKIGRLVGHRGPVNDVAFSPDGTTVATASDDHTARLWEGVVWPDLTVLRKTVCDIVGAGLGRADWQQYAPSFAYRRSCP